MPTALILAAGRGTRMRSALPKVLHPICGRTMLGWVVHAAKGAGLSPVVVVGHEAERVRAALPRARRARSSPDLRHRPRGALRRRRLAPRGRDRRARRRHAAPARRDAQPPAQRPRRRRLHRAHGLDPRGGGHPLGLRAPRAGRRGVAQRIVEARRGQR
ncbi:MAG: NTP transferase domain-containing protein [Deltaproteobacteria bacterium]|nr:NTP transferase domain-containing protein [Deltaproteobacteria bacterium]